MGGKNDKVSKRMQKAMETKAGEIMVGKTEVKRKERGREKETRGEKVEKKGKGKTKKKKNNESEKSNRRMENLRKRQNGWYQRDFTSRPMSLAKKLVKGYLQENYGIMLLI